MHIKTTTHKVITSKGCYEMQVMKIVGLRLRKLSLVPKNPKALGNARARNK